MNQPARRLSRFGWRPADPPLRPVVLNPGQDLATLAGEIPGIQDRVPRSQGGAAGQALHRLLAKAAGKWVFASLHTQPLEAAAIRMLIRHRLALPGAPQLLLQLSPGHTTRSTARRPPADLTGP